MNVVETSTVLLVMDVTEIRRPVPVLGGAPNVRSISTVNCPDGLPRPPDPRSCSHRRSSCRGASIRSERGCAQHRQQVRAPGGNQCTLPTRRDARGVRLFDSLYAIRLSLDCLLPGYRRGGLESTAKPTVTPTSGEMWAPQAAVSTS